MFSKTYQSYDDQYDELNLWFNMLDLRSQGLFSYTVGIQRNDKHFVTIEFFYDTSFIATVWPGGKEQFKRIFLEGGSYEEGEMEAVQRPCLPTELAEAFHWSGLNEKRMKVVYEREVALAKEDLIDPEIEAENNGQ
uniref:Uncharacterized protein n=1 Tax=Ochrobactrum phage ORM_20 TaxID=2985243 RepID=A0A9N6WSM9_9VIRU|nr:hypothetical protein ORM20_00144 [Ochrobactrum phage ORM_20]